MAGGLGCLGQTSYCSDTDKLVCVYMGAPRVSLLSGIIRCYKVFVLCTVLQPVVVVSAHGAGRAGCLCSVAVAHELMTARQENPDCWTQDGHILDEVQGRNPYIGSPC